MGKRMSPLAAQFELRHLRYFVAAADYGSFRKASAALGIQESTISRRIRDLEDRLGASLFQRHSGGVNLTLAGRRFLRHARVVLRQIDGSVRDVAAVGRSERGRIKIGIFSSLASGFLFELLQAFDKDHAGVLIELVDGNPSEHVAAVRQLASTLPSSREQAFGRAARRIIYGPSVSSQSCLASILLLAKRPSTGPTLPERASSSAMPHRDRKFRTI